MLIKPAKFKKVKRIINERISHEVYGCDECRNQIDLNITDKSYLDLTIHRKSGETERVMFCSWRCAVEYIKKTKTDYFMSLPFLSFDIKEKGLRAKDFIDLLK